MMTKPLSGKTATDVAELLWRTVYFNLNADDPMLAYRPLTTRANLTIAMGPSLMNDTITLIHGRHPVAVKLDTHVYSIIELNEGDCDDYDRFMDTIGIRHTRTLAEEIRRSVDETPGKLEVVLGAPGMPAVSNQILSARQGGIRWLTDYNTETFQDRSILHTYMGIAVVE